MVPVAKPGTTTLTVRRLRGTTWSMAIVRLGLSVPFARVERVEGIGVDVAQKLS
jgi:hypothetical protein